MRRPDSWGDTPRRDPRFGPLKLLLVGGLLVSSLARADDVDVEARDAYDQGARAYEAHEYHRAAELFAKADERAPNALALKLALSSAGRDDDAVLGMTLVLRAERRGLDANAMSVARYARARFEKRVGVLRIVCAVRGTCHAAVANRKAGDGELLVVDPGEVELTFESAAGVTRTRAAVSAGATVDALEPAAPRSSTADVARSRATPDGPSRPAPTVAGAAPMLVAPAAVAPGPQTGLSQAFFWGGVGLTCALGALTVASGVDTVSRHDSFVSNRTPAASEQGASAETRTNVLLGASIASAIATGVVGVFLTKWRGQGALTADQSPAAMVVF